MPPNAANMKGWPIWQYTQAIKCWKLAVDGVGLNMPQQSAGLSLTASLSASQHDFATRRIAAAGLSDKAHIRMCDYRDLDQRYDKIISIEMFEVVGTYWPIYFQTLSKCLKTGGSRLQVITIDDTAFYEYKSQPDFIQKYIFLGGMPSMKVLKARLPLPD